MTESAKMLISFNMKKQSKNSELIAAEQTAQKDEIRSICEFYGITTTALATKAGVVPSTVNRFISAKEPKNALSSITMKKIRTAFPLGNNVNEKINGAEFALIYAVKEIIDILLHRKEATQYEITKDFIHALDHYRQKNSPNAVSVMDDLLAHVKGERHRENQQTMRTLLQLSPPR